MSWASFVRNHGSRWQWTDERGGGGGGGVGMAFVRDFRAVWACVNEGDRVLPGLCGVCFSVGGASDGR